MTEKTRKYILTVPHSGTRMLGQSLHDIGVEHLMCNGDNYPQEKHLKPIVIGHLYTHPFPAGVENETVVAVRDPLHMFCSHLYQVSGPDIPQWCKKVPKGVGECLAIMYPLPFFRIEDEFYKLGEFLGFEVPQTTVDFHSRGEYWLKRVVESRDIDLLNRSINMDWLRRHVPKIPAYQGYDLWWV